MGSALVSTLLTMILRVANQVLYESCLASYAIDAEVEVVPFIILRVICVHSLVILVPRALLWPCAIVNSVTSLAVLYRRCGAT
ncbi:hypothetical protein DEU56DRAFT_769766 [Suillus clintonianus]|uniref:uncharacterized protein n=1 Tax=Suillus clintonianus TaxID=1904413 RepID=UPI001B8843A6|nr:uncharacterized protein DEU56DRAFT_769766 [Suillus clintonianus]KAG2154685.1 hypothetical protein DEU56DRAFT_769766 [Suillus clintonianus]